MVGGSTVMRDAHVGNIVRNDVLGHIRSIDLPMADCAIGVRIMSNRSLRGRNGAG